MLLGLMFVVVLVAAFELVAARYGRDSRDGNDWSLHEMHGRWG